MLFPGVSNRHWPAVLFASFFLLLTHSACAYTEAACLDSFQGKTVLGLVEKVQIAHSRVSTDAMLDTGATNSAINARNIRVHANKQGREQVEFQIRDGNSGKWINLSRPLARYAWVQTHSGKPIQKIVVKLRVKVADIESSSEFYLMNRSPFKYPVLLGRSFLEQQAVVDVSRKHLAENPGCYQASR